MSVMQIPGGDPLRMESNDLENKLIRLRERAQNSEIGGENKDEKLWQVSRDLESIFLKQLIDTMQASVPESSLTGQSSGMETWKGMFNDELAKNISSTQSIGIAEMVYKQLSGDLNRHRDVPALSAAGTGNKVVNESRDIADVPAVPEVSGAETTSDDSSLPGPLTRFSEKIRIAAENYDLDPALIAAVIMQESGGNASAVSPAGAEGLMQLMPSTAKMLGVSDSLDAEQNIDGGSRYLKSMLDRYDGDETRALAAYNAGPGTVSRYGGVPPYRETMNYIDRVSQLKTAYTGIISND